MLLEKSVESLYIYIYIADFEMAASVPSTNTFRDIIEAVFGGFKRFLRLKYYDKRNAVLSYSIFAHYLFPT